jgi:hypothetical protein
MANTANATRLIGGKPPCHPAGENQPSKPIKNRWTALSSIANSRNFLEVMNWIKAFSSRKWV